MLLLRYFDLNFLNFQTKKKCKYVKGDIRDKKAVNDICKDIDCIWHNAAA